MPIRIEFIPTYEQIQDIRKKMACMIISHTDRFFVYSFVFILSFMNDNTSSASAFDTPATNNASLNPHVRHIKTLLFFLDNAGCSEYSTPQIGHMFIAAHLLNANIFHIELCRAFGPL